MGVHGYYLESICLLGKFDNKYGNLETKGEGGNIKFHKCIYIFVITSIFKVFIWSLIC